MTPMIMLDADIGSGVALIALLTAAVLLGLALRPALRRAARAVLQQRRHVHPVRMGGKGLNGVRRA